MGNRTFILVHSRLSQLLAAISVIGLLSCGGGGSSEDSSSFAQPEPIPVQAEAQSVGDARLLLREDFEGGQAMPGWT